MATVLITGASRGIGAALADEFARRGHDVIATMRRPEPSAARSSAPPGKLRTVPLDVADRRSIEAAARVLEGQPVDILVNNAGIFGYRGAGIGRIDDTVWREVMAVNVMGAYRVAETFLPHLRAGNGKTLVTVSSRMGSMGSNSSGGEYIYRSSKAAVNAVMRSLAVDLEPDGIVVAVLHPGWVRTAMGGDAAAIDSAVSARGMADVILGLGPAHSGGFFNYDGAPIVW